MFSSTRDECTDELAGNASHIPERLRLTECNPQRTSIVENTFLLSSEPEQLQVQQLQEQQQQNRQSPNESNPSTTTSQQRPSPAPSSPLSLSFPPSPSTLSMTTFDTTAEDFTRNFNNMERRRRSDEDGDAYDRRRLIFPSSDAEDEGSRRRRYEPTPFLPLEEFERQWDQEMDSGGYGHDERNSGPRRDSREYHGYKGGPRDGRHRDHDRRDYRSDHGSQKRFRKGGNERPLPGTGGRDRGRGLLGTKSYTQQTQAEHLQHQASRLRQRQRDRPGREKRKIQQDRARELREEIDRHRTALHQKLEEKKQKQEEEKNRLRTRQQQIEEEPRQQAETRQSPEVTASTLMSFPSFSSPLSSPYGPSESTIEARSFDADISMNDDSSPGAKIADVNSVQLSPPSSPSSASLLPHPRADTTIGDDFVRDGQRAPQSQSAAASTSSALQGPSHERHFMSFGVTPAPGQNEAAQPEVASMNVPTPARTQQINQAFGLLQGTDNSRHEDNNDMSIDGSATASETYLAASAPFPLLSRSRPTVSAGRGLQPSDSSTESLMNGRRVQSSDHSSGKLVHRGVQQNQAPSTSRVPQLFSPSSQAVPTPGSQGFSDTIKGETQVSGMRKGSGMVGGYNNVRPRAMSAVQSPFRKPVPGDRTQSSFAASFPAPPTRPLASSQRSFGDSMATQPAHAPPNLSASTANSGGTSITARHRNDPRGFMPRLRDFPETRDAIYSLRPERPALAVLAEVCRGAKVSGTEAQRQAILDFSGIPPGPRQRRYIQKGRGMLIDLTKPDIDSIAWAFGIVRSGKKALVVDKIMEYLRSPERRVITKYRPSSVLSASEAGDSFRLHSGVGATSIRRIGLQGDQDGHLRSGLTSMPRLPTPDMRRVSSASATRLPSHHALTSEIGSGRSSASLGKFDRIPLNQFDFMVPENPFNIPLGSPLGRPKYVEFNATSLDRGKDPSLNFPTPAPSAKRDDGRVEVHIRCLKMEKGLGPAGWKQLWPFPCIARVNSEGVSLVQAPRYTNGKLAGIDSATPITQYLKRYRGGHGGMNEMNRLVLRRNSTSASPTIGVFVMFVQEVLVKSTKAMVESVLKQSDTYWKKAMQRKSQVFSMDLEQNARFAVAKREVQSFMSSSGMEIENMKVSLKCPLSLMRIRRPVKGVHCAHIQCFDLETFLEFTRKSSKFECPVCNKGTTYPDMLVLSPYIERALELFAENDEIIVLTDASMEGVERTGPSGVASDDSDDDEDGGFKGTADKDGDAQSQKAQTVGVIDLTMDSDNDDGATNMADAPATTSGSMSGSSSGAPSTVPTSMPTPGISAQLGQQNPKSMSSFDPSNLSFNGLTNFQATQGAPSNNQYEPFRTGTIGDALDNILFSNSASDRDVQNTSQAQSGQATSSFGQNNNVGFSFGLQDMEDRPSEHQGDQHMQDVSQSNFEPQGWSDVISIDSD